MIYLLAALSLCLKIISDFDDFIISISTKWPGLISTVFAVLIITFLANDRPAVFSIKWFLIGFWILIIFLNTFLLLPEKNASIFLSSDPNRSLVNNTDNKKIVENQ